MFLKYYVVGDVQTNCYIAAADISKSCVVIDPGDEAEYIMSEAAKTWIYNRCNNFNARSF